MIGDFVVRLDSDRFYSENKQFEDERLAWELFERFIPVAGESLHIIDEYGNILKTRIG